jgi:tight adherence protein C
VTAAVLLAAAAGVCAAVALVGLADAVLRARTGRRWRRAMGGPGALAADSGARPGTRPAGGIGARPGARRQPADGARPEARSARGGRAGWTARRAAGTPARRLVAVAARVGRRWWRGPAPPDLRARMDAAGLSPALTPADLMAAKATAGLLGALAAAPAASAAPGRLGILVLVAVPVGAFLAPDAVLRRRARRRAARIELELADVTELLRVAIAAGLPPVRALAEVGRRHPGLLAGELLAAADRIALGVPHDEALGTLRRRAPVAGVAQLADALARAARHGAPPGPALEAVVADARAARSRAVRERAARAGPKIQLVVALLLVPAVVLLVAAALVASIT